MFDLRLSEEQREFRDLARKFAQEEIKPKAAWPRARGGPSSEQRIPFDSAA